MRSIIIVFIFCLSIASCSDEPGDLQSPKTINPDITLLVLKDSVPADNYTFAEIAAIINTRPAANDLIVFTTDRGVFTNNSNTYSVNVASNDTTRAFLKYNKAERARITATVFNKGTKETFVRFLSSYPTQILVYPDSASIQSSFTSKTLVSGMLLRVSGAVSEGLSVNYSDSTSVGSVGIFLNNTYADAQGKSTVEYWLQDTSYHGFVFIKASVNTGAEQVTGVNKIRVL